MRAQRPLNLSCLALVFAFSTLVPVTGFAKSDDVTAAEQNACEQSLSQVHAKFVQLKKHVSAKVLEQEELVNGMMISVLVGGHMLVESPHGAAKTRAIKSLAEVMEGTFGRVQFAPDLLPSQITGVSRYNSEKHDLDFHPGPVFVNLLLADEINRAPPSVQAGLLQAMEEGEVTVDGVTRELPKVHMVLATQNPIGDKGTFELSWAQLDRFLFKILLDYPSYETERRVSRLVHQERVAVMEDTVAKIQKIISLEDIRAARRQVLAVLVPENVEEYATKLVVSTRPKAIEFPASMKEYIQAGASPRTTLSLLEAARALAWIDGKTSVDISDVDRLAHSTLRHRIIMTETAGFEGKTSEWAVDKLIANLKGRK